jgi:hypothetical protein
LRPMAAQIRVVDTVEGLVVEALEDIPPLTDAMVQETLDRIRPHSDPLTSERVFDIVG